MYHTKPTMQATFTRGMIFRRIIDSFQHFITEGNFFCLEDSITLQAMDTSHVSLVSMCLREFGSYSCQEPFYMGVHISNLCKILKCMDPEDTLTLGGDPDTPELSIEFESSKRVAQFRLHLMEIEAEQMDIPEMDYDCVLVMASAEFKRIITDLQAFGETMIFSATTDGFLFQVKGDTGKANILLKAPEQYTCEVDTIAEFSNRHLTYFAKASGLSPNVTLKMSANAPLVVEYTFDEGHVRFYLSPKMIDD
jgi:proliferating cell nuclear antigen